MRRDGGGSGRRGARAHAPRVDAPAQRVEVTLVDAEADATPPRALPEDEVEFLRGLVAELQSQSEEQAVLMEDMAARLRKQRPSTRSTGAQARMEDPRMAQLTVVAQQGAGETSRLAMRVAELEGEVAAGREAQLLAEARMEEALGEAEGLKRDLAALVHEHELATRSLQEIRAERVQWEREREAAEVPAGHSDERVVTELSQALAKLSRDVNRSEKNALKDRAHYLGESKVLSQELQGIAGASAELLSHVRDLSVAASYTVRDEVDKAAAADGPGQPTLHTSLEAWERVEKDLVAFTVASPKHIAEHPDEVVKAAYLSRLGRVIQGYTSTPSPAQGESASGDDAEMSWTAMSRSSTHPQLDTEVESPPLQRIDVAALRRESERITRELQLEHRIGLPHQLRLVASVCSALRMAFREIASAGEVFGIQARAIAAIRGELQDGREATRMLQAELKRVTKELGTANHAAGVASVELNVAGLESEVDRLTKELRDVYAENTRIKQFMSKLKLSHLLRLQHASSPAASPAGSPARVPYAYSAIPAGADPRAVARGVSGSPHGLPGVRPVFP